MPILPSHFLAGLSLSCLLLLPLRTAAEPNSHPKADTIFLAPKILTADPAFSVAQAMAVTDGRITKIGNRDDILQLRGENTELVQLPGAMVLPGLIDSHVHSAAAAMTEFDHPIPDMESIDDVLRYIRRRAEDVPPGEWIVLRQVFITRLKEQRYPTRAELDQAAPQHPVLFATGPDASLNSLALKLSGIDRDFQVTDGGTGFAEKDPATGEPTGILRNCTRYVRIKTTSKPASLQERAARLKTLLTDYNRVGITAVCDRNAGNDAMELYAHLQSSGALTVRIHASRQIDSLGDLATVQQRIRSVAAEPWFKNQDPWLRVIGVKLFLDGGMLTGSAYMREPWGLSQIYAIHDPDYCGVLFISEERLLPMVRTAVEAGLQFTAHAVGDGAVHTLLSAYEKVAGEFPLAQTRPCISHSNFMSREAIETAARLGVVMDIQPAWLYLDAHTLTAQFGYDRMRYFQPLKTIFRAGAVAGGGSDHMQKIGSFRSVNPYNPFLGIATAVTRKGKVYRDRLHPEEALSREEAIRFYTSNNAHLLRREQDIGSLQPGKLADFILLDRDLLTCPEEEIVRTDVLRTYLAGKLVHEKSHLAPRQ